MFRSIVAVVAGLIVTVLLAMGLSLLAALVLGISPLEGPSPLYLTLNLLVAVIAGMSGGATAMHLAPHRPHGHVVALALAILLLSVPTIFSAPAPGQPAWYLVVMSVLGPGSVLLGGLLAGRRGAGSRARMERS